MSTSSSKLGFGDIDGGIFISQNLQFFPHNTIRMEHLKKKIQYFLQRKNFEAKKNAGP